MSIPTTGSVSLLTIQTEFGGVEPISISEYYKSAGSVPDTTLNTSIPTTGDLSISNFRGSSKTTFSVLPNSTNINEGDTVTFTVSTTDFGSGTLYWTLSTISGTITNGDFSSPSSVLSGGSVSVVNNLGSVSFTLANDALTEGTESFRLNLRINSTSGTVVATSSTVTVADTSLTPTFSLTRSAASVIEGNSFIITLTTTNVANGTVIPYTITGIQTDDIDIPLTGSFTVQNNTASLTVNVFVNADLNSYAYIVGSDGNDCIKEFRVSNDLADTLFVQRASLTATNFSYPHGMYFRNTGTQFWVQDVTADRFFRWTLSTAWDISTRGTAASSSYGTVGGDHRGMWISSSGTQLFQVDRLGNLILQDTISAWNPMLPGSPERQRNINTNGGITLPTGISVKPDGTRAFISTRNNGIIAEYTGTAFQCNTWTLNTTITAPGFPSDVFVNDAGTRMYICDDAAKIHYYTLSTAWSLASANFVRTWDLRNFNTPVSEPNGFNTLDAVYMRLVEPAEETFVLSLNNGASSVSVTLIDA